jgi:acyl carrier protein
MTSNDSRTGQSRPTRTEILEGVKRIVGEQMAIAPDQIQDTHHLENDIGCDSLDLVEIMMEVEDHFGVSVPDEISDQIRTIREIADNVGKLLDQCPAS